MDEFASIFFDKALNSIKHVEKASMVTGSASKLKNNISIQLKLTLTTMIEGLDDSLVEKYLQKLSNFMENEVSETA
jgi:hypothetical protein